MGLGDKREQGNRIINLISNMETKIGGRQIVQKRYIYYNMEIPLKLLATFKENNSAICLMRFCTTFWCKSFKYDQMSCREWYGSYTRTGKQEACMG